MKCRGARVIVILFCVTVSFSVDLLACSVPVFRYALERWPADSYTLVVACNTDLTAEQQVVVDALQNQTMGGEGALNLYVHTVNVATETNSPVLKYLEDVPADYPAMCLFYPGSFRDPEVIWQSALTKEAVALVHDSPVRSEIVSDIVNGRTAVWVLLESGNKDKDAAAFNLLRETLVTLEKELELPSGVVMPSGEMTGAAQGDEPEGYYDPENQLRSGIPLMISFAIVRLSRDNSDEELLRAMLLNMEPDLKDLSGQPMVFPVFGRGRVLEPLVGEGVNEENIAGMSYYICGACSCQIKAQNPGVDLMLAEDWDAGLMGISAIEERELPPLSGTADVIKSAPVVESPVDEASVPLTIPAEGGSRTLLRNVVIAGIIVVSVVLAFTMTILRRKR